MNANAYGGELAKVLEWVDVCTAAGRSGASPASSASPTAARTSDPARWSPGPLPARAGRPGARSSATLAAMRGRRREAQPSGIKTFGSTFKNPDDERAGGRTAGQLLEAAGCRGLRHGGARFSEKHANFVENKGEATTADVLELMAEGRRRVHERFGVDARARGPGAGRGRVAPRMGPRPWTRSARRRG